MDRVKIQTGFWSTAERYGDIFFYVGVFLIPFDNLFFAPSTGWATIAPILFFLYLACNLRYVTLSRKSLAAATVVICVSLINYLFYPPVLDAVFDTVSTAVLGFSFYFALNIHFNQKKNSPKRFLRILFVAYTISFFYGVIDCLGLDFVSRIMAVIEKRNNYDRLQFTFTEPSFISMHLYGVILPCLFLFKDCKRECKNLFILLCAFVIVTCVLGESARFYLDTAAVVGLMVLVGCVYGLKKFFAGKITRKKVIILFAGIAVLAVFVAVAFYLLTTVERLRSILEKGIYADASLASRWFRMNAIIKGLMANPVGALFGYGIGNTFVPFNMGYAGAVAEYNNAYVSEVIGLLGTTTTSFYCGHLRVIADLGLIFYLLFFAYLSRHAKQNPVFFLITLYLYIQFDSIAFYTIWLYIFSFRYRECRTGQDRLLKPKARGAFDAVFALLGGKRSSLE